jgi:hypothetical protein
VALTRELEEGPALPPGRHTRPSSSGSPTSASPARGRPRRRASSLPSTASTTDALRAGLPAVTDGSYTWV